jgi:hypothetical protein
MIVQHEQQHDKTMLATHQLACRRPGLHLDHDTSWRPIPDGSPVTATVAGTHITDLETA